MGDALARALTRGALDRTSLHEAALEYGTRKSQKVVERAVERNPCEPRRSKPWTSTGKKSTRSRSP